MAVDVEVIGNGRYAGAKSAVGDYSVSEESTPAELSDSSGGVGQITFSAVDDPSRFGSALLLNDIVRLSDGDRGTTEGKINAITGRDGFLNVTADSRLARLVIDTKATFVNGTFGSAMTYYLSLGGITTNIAIAADLAAIPVVLPGWFGNLWIKIKELCIVHGAEISLVKGDVVVRRIRERRALEINNVEESWSFSNSELAQSVEVAYYDSTYKSNALIYPKGGWDENVTVYTIDAGQRSTVNVRVGVSLASVVQPTCENMVTKQLINDSVYCVTGSDNQIVDKNLWSSEGGLVEVVIGEDGESIDLTIQAPEPGGIAAAYAPFRIGVSEGPSEYYSSIRILGTGVHYEEKIATLLTGVGADVTSRVVGTRVNSTAVRTLSQALSLGVDIAAKWAAPKRTISINKANIVKPGETTPSFDYGATFADFDAYATGAGITTFAQFDTAWSGDTFKDFDNYWYQQVASEFQFQVFGNANGARVQWRRAMYRIRESTIKFGDVTYTAEADTTIGDFDASASPMTIAQFDTMYANMTFEDFGLIPLPKVLPEYDRV